MSANRGLCVVTGASRGIGSAIALRFLGEGFAVLAISRTTANMEQFSIAARNAYPNGTLHTHVADLSVPKEATQSAAHILSLAEETPLRVLVNNAGRFAGDTLLSSEQSILADQINTNLYSAYYLTCPLLPYFVAQEQGHIFTIGSVAGLAAYPGGASYCISKYALRGFTDVLRSELANCQVRSTAIFPGATLTDSWKGTTLPPERFIQPDDIASTVWNAYTLSTGAVVEDIILRPQRGDL